jgi:hypothetical protein
MGATSVTGKGRGSADGKNKGSAHMTLGVAHLIGPNIVAAGKATLSDGTVSLDLVPMDTSKTYVVLATDQSANAVATGTFVSSTGTLTLKGTTTDVISYVIVKIDTSPVSLA